MPTFPTNTDDLIDSRDVIAALAAGQPEEVTDDEWADLVALADEAQSYSDDWLHGATLISDSYFVEYAQQVAEDAGYVQDAYGWPHRHIDWEEAAEELKYDYSCVHFGGETYWVR